jgi:hypothetical protein
MNKPNEDEINPGANEIKPTGENEMKPGENK